MVFVEESLLLLESLFAHVLAPTHPLQKSHPSPAGMRSKQQRQRRPESDAQTHRPFFGRTGLRVPAAVPLPPAGFRAGHKPEGEDGGRRGTERGGRGGERRGGG